MFSQELRTVVKRGDAGEGKIPFNYLILILDMGFPLIHIRSRIVFWSPHSQLCSAWGQPVGRVEQSHGDILSDGISCGGWAMLPNCQADFTVMRRGGGGAKQTETWHNLPSPSSTDVHRENLPGDHRRLRWNGKQDLTFLLLLEPSSLEPARLKVRAAKRSEKAITAAKIQRPSLGRELQYQPNQEKKKGKYCPPL